MIQDFSIIVSSCEKYSDLWTNHFNLLKQHWIGELPKIYLVTDKETDYKYEGVNVLVYDGDMPFRLKKTCQSVEEKYVLITLDDYYVISDVYEKNINRAIELIQENNIDYLSIYNRLYCKKKYYSTIDDIKKKDLSSSKYAVDLYPAIWRKDFFIFCVDDDDTPWDFEPKLTKKAKEYNANCYYNISGAYDILDVVRKGRILRKANRYFKKNKINIGNRPLTSWKTEFIQASADFTYRFLPRWFYRLMKSIAKLFGIKTYGDD